MDKPADTRYPIDDLLRRRWSPRAFSGRSVEPHKLRSLFEAARWAPSCFNEQPWSFLAATQEDREEHGRLASCLVEGNAWARQAPVLALSVAKHHFERNQKPNRHAFHDVGLAVENLVVQATSLGLFVHQMAGFHIDKARELFQIPDGHEPVAMIALGYYGDAGSLSEELRAREMAQRTRKPIEEFVFTGRWGQTSKTVVE